MQTRKTFFTACLVLLIMALPLMAQGTKIKVIVENASIRLKPSLDSEAIEESVALNTVFTAEKKVGEWYEVKVPSNVGVLLIGYIHEMYVEVLAEEAPRPPAQEEKPPAAQVRRPEPLLPAGYGPKKMEIFFGGGLGFGSFLSATSAYSDSWSYGWLTVDEGGQIQHKVNNPFGLGISFSYFFTDELGLRLRADPNFGQNISNAQSHFSADYVWGWGSDSDDVTWPVTGDLSVLPLSLDLVYRFPAGSFAPYLNAGISYFISNFKSETNIGWSNSWWITYLVQQAYDYLVLPVSIDESLNGVGFNFGAGFDFLLGPSLALTLDASYFLGPSVEAKWYMPPGDYYYVGWTNTYTTFTQADSNEFADYVDPVKINTSFFKILFGLKVLF
jgi:outer membrane protein W